MENIFFYVFLLTGILFGLAISPLGSGIKIGKVKVFYSVRTFDEYLGTFDSLSEAEKYLEDRGFINHEGMWFGELGDMYKIVSITRYEGRESK